MKDLKESLKEGIVLIKFRSLKSGEEKIREFTLNEKFMKVPNHIKNFEGDKLLCYDLEFARWEDIQVDTIINWKVLEKC